MYGFKPYRHIAFLPAKYYIDYQSNYTSGHSKENLGFSNFCVLLYTAVFRYKSLLRLLRLILKGSY